MSSLILVPSANRNCRLSLCFNLFCFLLTTFVPFSTAFETPSYQIGRIQYWSSDAPIANLVNKLPEVKIITTQILQHFSRSEKRILRFQKDQIPPSKTSTIRPCNFDDAEWRFSVDAYFHAGKWQRPLNSCITGFLNTEFNQSDNPPVTTRDMYLAVKTRGDILKSVAKKEVPKIAYNYTNPDFGYNYPYSTADQQCTLHNLGAVRLQDKWYLLTAFTNAPKGEQLPDYNRTYIQEVIRVNGDTVEAARMTLRKGPFFNKSKGEIVEDATTSFSTWHGETGTSFFKRVPNDKNPAIVDALDAGELDIQQANDAVTPSNIAILFLPLGLNLVPIALLAHVSTLTTFIYTLLSDVLTVFPLGIKGIELIIIGQKTTRSFYTRISSTLDGERSPTAVAEAWTAECRAEAKVKNQGIIYFTIAVVFLVVGIISEIVARHYSIIRRNRQMKLLISMKHNAEPGSGEYFEELESHGDFDEQLRSLDPTFMQDNKAI